MARNVWHRLREEHAVTVTRRLPVRFDLSVSAELAVQDPVSLTRVAHQVRQDMWRALQGLRGFSPAVRVEAGEGALRITAGGRMEGAQASAAAAHQLGVLLDSPAHHARWLRHAALTPSAEERAS
jgi:hypothetical protein